MFECNWGEEYTGPGRADPTKTRAERERQLREMWKQPMGRGVVEYYFLKYTGSLEGKMAPVGVLIFETILNHEYPNG